MLLFLHGDCTLEAGALTEAVRCLRRRNVAAGCFLMRVKATESCAFRSIDFCATARVRLAGIIYGDQGFFLTRQRFDLAGGFPEIKLMEDVFLSLKLRRTGRMVVAPRGVRYSCRQGGAELQTRCRARQTLREWTLTALAAAGCNRIPINAGGLLPRCFRRDKGGYAFANSSIRICCTTSVFAMPLVFTP